MWKITKKRGALFILCLINLTNCHIVRVEIIPNRSVSYYESLKLHVFEHWKTKPGDLRQAIVFFHGGGWTGGNWRQFSYHANDLKRLGISGFCAEYTLGKGPHRCVDDAVRAIRYVRNNARSFGVDPNNIWVCGGSSGGHLAIMTAIEGEKVAGVIAFNPVLKSDYIDISPIDLTPITMPPTLILSGDVDYATPVEIAQEFCQAVNGKLIVYKNQKHGFWNYAESRRMYKKTMREMVVFFKQNHY